MTGDAVRPDGPSSYLPVDPRAAVAALVLGAERCVAFDVREQDRNGALVGNHDSMGPAAGTVVGACSGNLVHRDLIGDAAQQCLLRHRRQPGSGK